MATLEDVKNYLKIDYLDEDQYLQMIMEVSQIYIDKCCGEAYKSNEKMIKLASLAQLKLINDLYENRSTFIDNNIKSDYTISTIFALLSLEGESYES